MTIVGTNNESERDRWISAKLSEMPAGWRLLDAGAGQQKYRSACGHLDYVSQDFAEYEPGQVAAGLHCAWDYKTLDITSDITAIPRPDASFDAVLCSEVFEHLPDPLAALREFARLVRPGGRLILTAPFLSLTHFAPYHFATGFNRYFYETHLAAHGFRVDEIAANGNYFELMAQELRRIPSVADRFCQHARLQVWERWGLKWLLRALQRFSKGDEGSAELACFGLQVVATRVSSATSAAA